MSADWHGWPSIASKLVGLSFVFFFQAEDGIRDLTVTGVQTCALPIFGGGIDGPPQQVPRDDPEGPRDGGRGFPGLGAGRPGADRLQRRGAAPPADEIGRASLGEECRSRWSPYH